MADDQGQKDDTTARLDAIEKAFGHLVELLDASEIASTIVLGAYLNRLKRVVEKMPGRHG